MSEVTRDGNTDWQTREIGVHTDRHVGDLHVGGDKRRKYGKTDRHMTRGFKGLCSG